MVARQEVPVHHQMHALARRHHGPGLAPIGLRIHAAQGVDPDPGGVDDAARAQLPGLAGLRIAALQAAHACGLVLQGRDRAVVEQQSAFPRRAARQHQGKAGVVELAVPVLDAAAQVLGAHRGQELLRLARRQKLRGSQSGLTRQQVIGLQAGAVKRRFPPAVGRHHKRQRLRQVRRIAQQDAALVQRLVHQRNIALRQVAHTTVHQLGGARGRALGKVVRLQQHHAQAPQHRIQRQAQAGGAAANDGQVVGLGCVQACQQRGALGRQRGAEVSHSGERSLRTLVCQGVNFA